MSWKGLLRILSYTAPKTILLLKRKICDYSPRQTVNDFQRCDSIDREWK
jgi:hypothetical protein